MSLKKNAERCHVYKIVKEDNNELLVQCSPTKCVTILLSLSLGVLFNKNTHQHGPKIKDRLLPRGKH